MKLTPLALALLVAGATGAYAHPDPTQWALGLSLPKMNGVSIWRVGPKAAHGITYDAGARFFRVPFSTRREDRDGTTVVSRNNWSHSAELSYVGLRFRSSRKKVKPFWYYGAGGNIRFSEGDFDYLTLTLQSGFGITWKPLSSVDLHVRQGFYGHFGHRDQGQRWDGNRVRDYWSRTIFFNLASFPRVTVLFRF